MMRRLTTVLLLLCAAAIHYALVFCGGWFLIDAMELRALERQVAFGVLVLIGFGALLYPMYFVRVVLNSPNVRSRRSR